MTKKQSYGERIKSFLMPTPGKLLLSIFLLIWLGLSAGGVDHMYSNIILIVIVPFFLIDMLRPLVMLFIPLTYVLSCGIVWIFVKARKNKLFIALFIVGSFLLLGLDEPLINNTINEPDYTCNTDSDCTLKRINPDDWCSRGQCTNTNWNYYNSLINKGFALSCGETPPIGCVCEANTCVTKDARSLTSPEQCDNIDDFMGDKQDCLRVINTSI